MSDRNYIRVQFSSGELTCEVWCWDADWHWKVSLNEERLVCMKKERTSGSRWKLCPREELPASVLDRITGTLKDLSRRSLQVRTVAIGESAARMGIVI